MTTTYPPLTTYRVYYNDGSKRIVDMAPHVTLKDAIEYFVDETFTDENPETGAETRRTCIKVEPYHRIHNA